MQDVKLKIKKLLALAESPNENEAKAALLKARQLMVENKLSETECLSAAKQTVKHICTGYTFSKRRDPWMCELSTIIGENYCCQAYRRKKYRKQTNEVCFVGLEDDADICAAVFRYALQCITSECVRLSKHEVNGYARGFTNGLRTAFGKQLDENRQEWGLVPLMPQEVVEATSRMKKETFVTHERITEHSYAAGYQDGTAFDPKHRIGTKIK